MDHDTDNFLLVIKEYESVIQTLSSQIEFYAKEQEKLRKEIIILVAENKKLSETINEVLGSQSSLHKIQEENKFENNVVGNLKNQLGLTLKEKDTVVQLWQSALKNIDHLEEELKLFEGRTHGYFSKPQVIKFKQKYEKQIKDLQAELKTSQSKLADVSNQLAKKIDSKDAELEKAADGQKKLLILVEQLENEIKRLHNKLKETTTIKDKLQMTLESKDRLVEEFKTKDAQSRAKVTEAIEIVENAFLEKDAAISRENEVKEEVAKLSKTLSEVIDETTDKVQREIEKVKKEHCSKLNAAQQNMKKLKEELHLKNTELEKYMTECKSLQEELKQIKNGNVLTDDTSKLLLQNKCESTFQKLLLSERKNLQLTTEKDSIKAHLDKITYDMKTRETEKQVLKQEVKILRKQLKLSKSNLVLVAGEIDKMNSKIKLLDNDIREKLQEQDVQYQEEFNKAIKIIESKNIKVQKELLAQLELHVNLNTKYKNEIQEIISKFENRMKELKEVNKSLKNKLKKAVNKTFLHKRKIPEICKDSKNVVPIHKSKNNLTSTCA